MAARNAFLTSILLAAGAFLLLPLPGLSAPLPERIEHKRAQVERQGRRVGVLTSTIERYATRIDGLEARIAGVRDDEQDVELRLVDARADLLETENRLERARDSLARAVERLRVSRRALRARLVELYKTDQPDLLTVVLNADGFDDLLDRVDFADRVAEQDRAVISEVREDKGRAERATRTLAAAGKRQELVAQRILSRRDELVALRLSLTNDEADLRRVSRGRRAVLADVRSDRRRAQEDLASLEREQQRVQAQLAARPAPDPMPGAAPIRSGSGGLIWPIDGPLTSPFGTRWGRLHAGIDISAPDGTPIRAAASGTVVIAAWTGGYGNYTCIAHSALTTCYAHQSRLGTTAGATVRQGEVMGYVGNTGNSFGAHLHFEVRVGGSPVDPLGYL